MKILNIYGQPFEHQDVKIIGNTEGLIALRDTINRILQSTLITVTSTKDVSDEPLFASDGEGYSVIIECHDDKWGIEGGKDSFWNKKESYPLYYTYEEE